MWKVANFRRNGAQASGRTNCWRGSGWHPSRPGRSEGRADFASPNTAFIAALNAAFGIKSPAANLETVRQTNHRRLGLAGVLESTDEFNRRLFQALLSPGSRRSKTSRKSYPQKPSGLACSHTRRRERKSAARRKHIEHLRQQQHRYRQHQRAPRNRRGRF